MAFDFDFQATDHSRKNALRLAEASEAAYDRGGDGLAQWASQWGLPAPFAFNVRSVEGFLAEDAGHVFLVFRGTNNPEDWLTGTDADLVPASPFPGKVHDRFQSALDGIWPIILGRLQTHANGPVWIAGHDLGGALALLTAARILFTPIPVLIRGVYTYGQPRTGNLEFASAYDDRMRKTTFRHVNELDIVPRVPAPSFTGLGYRHAGREFLISRDPSQPVVADSDTKLRLRKLVSRGAADAFRSTKSMLVGRPQGIEDHFVEQYVKRLGREVPSPARTAVA